MLLQVDALARSPSLLVPVALVLVARSKLPLACLRRLVPRAAACRFLVDRATLAGQLSYAVVPAPMEQGRISRSTLVQLLVLVMLVVP